MVDIQSIPLALIDLGPRLRAIDQDFAQLLAGAMADNGQQTAVEVRPMPGGRFDLVAGGHRMAAAAINEWTHIDATITPMTDDEKELRQIDENLLRRELSPFDRATFLAHRQAVYLRLHPDTGRGKAGADARWMQRTQMSFASETGDKLRVSPRHIRRMIARHTSIAVDVREKIACTWIAESGPVLDALARSAPSDQRKAITVMLRTNNPVRSVKAALLLVNGGAEAPRDVDAEQLAKVMRAWREAGSKAKALFLEWLVGNGVITHDKMADPEPRKAGV